MHLEFLTPQQVRQLNASCLTPTEDCVVRDEKALLAATERPQCGTQGEYFFKTIPEQGAVLLDGLVRYHPFEQGNKRTAVAALETFLTRHDYLLVANDDEKESLVVQIAQSQLRTEDVIAWVVSRVEPFAGSSEADTSV